MKRSASRALIPAVLSAIVLVFVAGLVLADRFSRPRVQATWSASTAAFSPNDQAIITGQLESALQQTSQDSSGSPDFDVYSADRSGDWAVFYADEHSSNGSLIPTEPFFFIAEKHGAGWSVWIPQSPGFCDAVRRVPDQLLSSGEKDIFGGCFAE